MGSFRIFLDTDVLINWLAKEIDPNTGLIYGGARMR